MHFIYPKNKVALKACNYTNWYCIRSVNVALRKELDLYAFRPCKSFNANWTKYKNIDIVVVRINTKDYMQEFN